MRRQPRTCHKLSSMKHCGQVIFPLPSFTRSVWERMRWQRTRWQHRERVMFSTQCTKQCGETVRQLTTGGTYLQVFEYDEWPMWNVAYTCPCMRTLSIIPSPILHPSTCMITYTRVWKAMRGLWGKRHTFISVKQHCVAATFQLTAGFTMLIKSVWKVGESYEEAAKPPRWLNPVGKRCFTWHLGFTRLEELENLCRTYERRVMYSVLSNNTQGNTSFS